MLCQTLQPSPVDVAALNCGFVGGVQREPGRTRQTVYAMVEPAQLLDDTTRKTETPLHDVVNRRVEEIWFVEGEGHVI